MFQSCFVDERYVLQEVRIVDVTSSKTERGSAGATVLPIVVSVSDAEMAGIFIRVVITVPNK